MTSMLWHKTANSTLISALQVSCGGRYKKQEDWLHCNAMDQGDRRLDPDFSMRLAGIRRASGERARMACFCTMADPLVDVNVIVSCDDKGGTVSRVRMLASSHGGERMCCRDPAYREDFVCFEFVVPYIQPCNASGYRFPCVVTSS